MTHEPFHTRLSRTRSSQCMTVHEVFKATRISPSTLNAYESGARVPNLKALAALAQCLDTSVDYLTGRTDERRKLPPERPATAFEARLKEVRAARGMTQKALAETLRMSHDQVRSWEHGGQLPGFWSLVEIAAKCHVSADWLMGMGCEMEAVC
jgi:transcriptional regulator with XRE-family HTH domain